MPAKKKAQAEEPAFDEKTFKKEVNALIKEYKKKGISEADIQEFISREYNVWDGK